MAKPANRLPDPTGLVPHLDALLGCGAEGPADLIAQSPVLIDRLYPVPELPLDVRAEHAYRVLVAAIGALGHPRGEALRALFNIGPTPRRGRILLTQTERREKAGVVYGLSGETIRRHYEQRLVLALALELARRTRTGHDTTHGTTGTRARFLAAPPPPAAHFRPTPKPGHAELPDDEDRRAS